MVNFLVMSNRGGPCFHPCRHCGGHVCRLLAFMVRNSTRTVADVSPAGLSDSPQHVDQANVGGKYFTNITQCAAVEFVDFWMSPLSGA